MTLTTLTPSPATSTAPAGPAVRRRKASIALWVRQVLLAAAFVMAAVNKFTRYPEAVATFDRIGFGHWFMYLIATSSPASGGAESVCAGVPLEDPALGRPLTLARRLAAGRSPQPICSASSTMIADVAEPIAVFVALHLATANATWRMPGVFAVACRSPPRPDGA
jgi:hypothetical protein